MDNYVLFYSYIIFKIITSFRILEVVIDRTETIFWNYSLSSFALEAQLTTHSSYKWRTQLNSLLSTLFWKRIMLSCSLLVPVRHLWLTWNAIHRNVDIYQDFKETRAQHCGHLSIAIFIRVNRTLSKQFAGWFITVGFAAYTMNPQKQKNWKLLIDPFLIKGSTKLVRYEGQVPGDATYPPVHVRDPRSHIPKLWSRLEVLDLPVPRFKVYLVKLFIYVIISHQLCTCRLILTM